MHWNTTLLPAAEALNSVRRDFERAVGRRNDAEFSGLAAHESAQEFTVIMDLPGVRNDDIQITLHDGLLTIEAKRTPPALPEGTTELFSDRASGEFRRVLKLKEPVDRDTIDAELKDGVLTVKLPRIAERQPAKISVRTA